MRLRNMLLRQLTFFAHKMVAKENIFFEKLCMINLFFRCVEIGIGVKHRKSKARRHGTGLLDFLWGWTRGNGWYKVPTLWKMTFSRQCHTLISYDRHHEMIPLSCDFCLSCYGHWSNHCFLYAKAFEKSNVLAMLWGKRFLQSQDTDMLWQQRL